MPVLSEKFFAVIKKLKKKKNSISEFLIKTPTFFFLTIFNINSIMFQKVFSLNLRIALRAVYSFEQ